MRRIEICDSLSMSHNKYDEEITEIFYLGLYQSLIDKWSREDIVRLVSRYLAELEDDIGDRVYYGL